MKMNPADRQVFNKLFATAWGVVGPYLKGVFTEVSSAEDPVEALNRVLRKSKGALAGVAGLLAGVGGAAGGGALAVAAMGFWTGVGYWLGVVSLPLLWPVVGALIGAGGVGGAVYALLTRLDATEKLRLATLYAHSLSVVVVGKGDTPAQRAEVAKLKDRLVALGVPARNVAELFRLAPKSVDEFEVDPAPFSVDTLKTVLTEVWLAAKAAHCEGDEVIEAFDRLCARLGIGDQAVSLRGTATSIAHEAMARAPAVATAAAYAAPDIGATAAALFDELLSADFTGNASRRRAEIISTAAKLVAAATAIGAAATGHGEILAVVAEGYATARASLAGDAKAGKVARGRALELLSQLGIKQKDADAYLKLVDGVLADTTKRVEAEAAKRQKTEKPSPSAETPAATTK